MVEPQNQDAMMKISVSDRPNSTYGDNKINKKKDRNLTYKLAAKFLALQES